MVDFKALLENESNILKAFPVKSLPVPRQSQIDVLLEIEELIANGTDRIKICMPTGSGKSGVAVAAMNYHKKSGTNALVTSPLNILVDQYQRDFEGTYLATLKGRKHYPCIAKHDEFSLSHPTCDEGYCQSGLCSSEPYMYQKTLEGELLKIPIPRHCDVCDNSHKCKCHSCVYRIEKNKFQNSFMGNTNMTLFLMGIDNDPGIVVIDECDDAESFVRMFNTFTIPKLHPEFNVDEVFEDLCLNKKNFSDHMIVIDDLMKTLTKLSEGATEEPDIKYFKQKINQIGRIIVDYESNKEPWLIESTPEKYTYKPITVDRFLDVAFEGKTVIQMSATPPQLPGYKSIEVGSPFDPKIRPWEHVPIGKMSYTNRPETIPKLAEWLLGLPDGKTVVHCVSYTTAREIANELINLGCEDFLLQVSGMAFNSFEVERVDAVQKFKSSRNDRMILLSVKLDRGVDFPEYDIINNVIPVIPRPNPKDPLTIAKNRAIGTNWQIEYTASTIMQMYGRVNRNDQKTTQTYITCTTFNDSKGRGPMGDWFDKSMSYFYEWFLEAEIKNHTNK